MTVLWVLLAASACGTQVVDSTMTAAGPGTAPQERPDPIDLELPRLDGGSWRLSEERGQVVVLHFFATFDAPSQSLAPILERTHIEYLHQGAIVVGVSMDPGDGEARRRVVETYCALGNVTFEVTLSTPELSSGSTDVGRIPAIPATIIIDREGRPVAALTGIFPQSDLDRALRSLVGRDAPAE